MLAEEERAMLEEAVEAWDAALADKPHASHAKITDATRAIVRLRDALIARRRNGGDADEALGRVNAVLSAADGAQFPIIGVRWERIETTRDALKEALRAA
jgi:hypothetical protein